MIFSYVAFICTILRKNSSVCILFLIGSGMWILLFLFLLIHILLVYFLCPIKLALIFNSLMKPKIIAFFLFLMCWFLSIKTSSQQLSSENLSSFADSLPLHALSNDLQEKKGLLPIVTFFMLYTFAVAHLFFPMNLNQLKSLSVFWQYYSCIIDEALCKFKNPKCSACHSNEPCSNPVILYFYFSTSFKNLKFFPVLAPKSALICY